MSKFAVTLKLQFGDHVTHKVNTDGNETTTMDGSERVARHAMKERV